MNKKTKIISGFPGVGKSFIFNENKELIVLDSDSSKFSWIEEGVRHPDFPNNYIAHIKENMGKADIILVSSHDVVRKALEENEIEYSIVYPDFSSKEVYLKRYKERGNNEGFIKLMNENWDKFISGIEEETFPKKIKLIENQYLKDVI